MLEEHIAGKKPFFPSKPSEDLKKAALLAFENEDDDVEMESEESEDERPKQRWDCESIHQATATYDNGPNLIKEVSRKRKMGLTKSNLRELNHEAMDDDASMISAVSVSTVRPKGETPEERRIRKASIREERRKRREEKKCNQNAFKEMKKEMNRQRRNIKVNARPIN